MAVAHLFNLQQPYDMLHNPLYPSHGKVFSSLIPTSPIFLKILVWFIPSIKKFWLWKASFPLVFAITILEQVEWTFVSITFVTFHGA